MVKSRILIAVGSRQDEVCGVGAFARAEMRAFEKFGNAEVRLCEPSSDLKYPVRHSWDPNFILFHSPSLVERRKIIAPFRNLLTLRKWHPRSKLISVVHEYSEAPLHWRIRQRLLASLSSACVVGSFADHEGLRDCGVPLLRVPLGPPLFDDSLYGLRDIPQIERKISVARAKAVEIFRASGAQLSPEELLRMKWVVHPGLLAQGKGLDALLRIVADPTRTEPPVFLIVMGGKGPGGEDAAFASSILEQLASKLGDRLLHLDSPPDPVFSAVLQASDLVLLPYDEGLSERRSSFLSAMSCGALVATTRGKYTGKLGVDSDGVVFAGTAGELASKVQEALAWDEPMQRRARNVAWAEGRSWPNRIAALQLFLDAIVPS